MHYRSVKYRQPNQIQENNMSETTPYPFSLDGTLQQAFILSAREPDSDAAARLRQFISVIVTYQAVHENEHP